MDTLDWREPANDNVPALCLACGDVIPARTGPGRKAKYCGDECRHKPSLYVDSECSHCGATMEGRKRKFCDAVCRAANLKLNRTPAPKKVVLPVAHKCPQCEIDFIGHPDRVYCGSPCRRRAKDKRLRHINAQERDCEYCGVRFKRKRHSKDAARFCSRECGFAATSEYAGISVETKATAESLRVFVSTKRCRCEECGARFSGVSLGAKICTEACRRSRLRRLYVVRQLARDDIDRSERQCPECAKTFAPPYGRAGAKFCCNECAAKNSRRTSKAKRRARIRAVANDNVNPFKVFDRDGWQCRLCGVKTPRRLRGSTEDRAPELDHILPLSAGGSHTYDNVQCACRKCNAAKGATPMGQMLLFG